MRTREARNGLNSLLVLISVCVLFYFLFGNVVTKQLMFVPGPASYDADTDGIRLIEAEDGTQLAVFWGSAYGAKRTVFYFHGNAEDLGNVSFILNNYRLQGVNVLSFDYRGYGLSGGSASERLCYADAERVLEYAVSDLGIQLEEVVFHGRSLGSGVAMEMATRHATAGLILESAFLSAYRLYLPLKGVPGDKFTNFKKADEVDCPTLLVHGMRDQVVPFEHGEELSELLDPELVKTLWLPRAGHNDVLAVASSEYWAGIRGFLAGL